MMTIGEIIDLGNEIRMDKIEHAKAYWRNPFSKKLPELRKRIYKNTQKLNEALCDMPIDKRLYTL